MDYKEEISQLREKLTEYEEVLQKVFTGPLMEGKILSIAHNKMYRISTGGKEVILPYNPENQDLSNLKIGAKVLANEKAIFAVLPDELAITPTPVEFNFIDWNSIGGLKSQLSKIRDIIEIPVKHSSLYKEYGLSTSKGIALYGPPGCGKTMVAKAIASTFLRGAEINKDSFIYMKGGEMLSPYVGVAENNIKAAFDRARINNKKNGQRTVIFIDEAEAILPVRGSGRSSDVEKTIVPTFLSEMDGFEESSTFIILATNHINMLDSAVIRPGRIDLTLEISKPDYNDTMEIFGIYLKKTKLAEKDLAQKTTEYLFKSAHVKEITGAYIKNIVEKASMNAIKREIAKTGPKGVSLEDIINAIEK